MKRVCKKNKEIEYNLKELEKEAAVICQDFEAFCDYVLKNEVKLAKNTGNIGKKDCFALNALFHVKEEYEKPTRVQNQYPIINFFYYIAVEYKILETNSAGTSLKQGRNYRIFQDASVWERYIFLLVIFLFDGMFFGGGNSWYAGSVAEVWQLHIDSFMEWFDREKPLPGSKYQLARVNQIDYACLDIIMPYLQELKLIGVWSRPAGERWDEEYWWGMEVLPLMEVVSELYENIDIYEMEAMYSDDLILSYYEAYIGRIMQREKQNDLVRLFGNAGLGNQEQIIDLEVTVRYTECIRVIRMNLADSLYDLHRMIQEAVDFDDDHLFEFSIGCGMMEKTYTLSQAINTSSELPVEETSLRDLDLHKGQKFTYLFDFGDTWWFDIKVLAIQEGEVKAPEVIKAVNDAPEQYPDYEDEWQGWQAEISAQIDVSSILASVADERIKEEYAALMHLKSDGREESVDKMRQGIQRLLLEEPDRLLAFMTAEMRKVLSGLLQEEWIDESEKDTLSKLYALGCCTFSKDEEDTILVPESVKEVYLSKWKAAGKQDQIAETAETFLRRCGVMETERLYSAVVKFLKSRISYEDFEFLVYSRLCYFGAFYCGCNNGREYISCYEWEMTEKILAERQKPENAEYDYPDFEKIYSKKLKESPKPLKDWWEYINFHLSIDWRTAQELIEKIPAMAASGVIRQDEIVAAYKEMLRGTGSRATKKAEALIDELCKSLPLATKRGNAGLEEQDLKEQDLKEQDLKEQDLKEQDLKKQDLKEEALDRTGMEKADGKKKKKSAEEEYTQLSLFDL